MGRTAEQSIHEIDFCSQVASAANLLFAQDPSAFPFAEARVEGFGRGPGRRKRKDLRFFEPDRKLALCGEVKLPSTVAGRSPYDEQFYQDAAQKADNAAVRFFFTWNVNVFVLWDRSRWDRPILERRVREWKLGLNLVAPEDVAHEDTLDYIKTHFLPNLLRDLADIYTGRRLDWTMPPDDIFIRSLESHLDWPVQLTTSYLIERTQRSKAFDAKVQQWLADQDWSVVRNVPEEWHKLLSNMAKTLAYVWANRLIFYKALRARFADLPRLEVKRTVKSAEDAAKAFDRYFQKAVERSGDYEPLLFPNAKDWASGIVFEALNALDAWRGLLRGIESVDFKDVSSDIVGRIFQKLIGPEERHRYGQHFTGDDVVDLINSFCVRQATDKVLDPACGSGSFLVRAYYRKAFLDPARHHLDYLFELFGCDIALYPAHLATLNLAAREISDEANYPRIVRSDFFSLEREKPFCTVPDDAGGQKDILLPELDAVVGNPPYVRQEKIDKRDKERYGDKASRSWSNGLRLSGRADLHCYFWPVATKLLKRDGYFGFVTSSSWLDVEYGFPLQGWILRYFKLIAVMESAAEVSFTDARVKTAITILQRCDDEAERMANRVRFVRFEKPLRDIIGVASSDDEAERQRAVERLRDRILSAETDSEDDMLRILVKPQRELWTDGVRAGSILDDIPLEDEAADEIDDEYEATDEQFATSVNHQNHMEFHEGEYVAGKWGRYVRAPSLYFRFMERFGRRFVALGEIASVRRGITSGCDGFFMPRDITKSRLREYETDTAFRRNSGGAPRKDVESGRLRIIQAGDGSVHAIEAEFLAPEVHSLMKVDRPIVRARDLDRVVLLVSQPMKELRGTWVHKYLKYGEQATFASKKSKAVPVPQRSTCAARDPWYDLTRFVRGGFAFWPKGQQYRHVVIQNPARFPCASRLYYLESTADYDELAFVAILNSTIVAFCRNFFGRYTGTEGALETMVIDTIMTEVPDPRGLPPDLIATLRTTFRFIARRSIGSLVEEQLMLPHSLDRARRIAEGALVLPGELRQSDRRELDLAVLEALGANDPIERPRILNRLYEEVAKHFRAIRVVEIEKQEQRARSANRRFSVKELAADAWDAAELPDLTPLKDWIAKRRDCTVDVNIPEERPAVLSPSPMFDPNCVYFGKDRALTMDCRWLGEAQLVVFLAELGLSGLVKFPGSDEGCKNLLRDASKRVAEARARFYELAASRAGDERIQAQMVELLLRWFVFGRKPGESSPGNGFSEASRGTADEDL